MFSKLISYVNFELSIFFRGKLKKLLFKWIKSPGSSCIHGKHLTCILIEQAQLVLGRVGWPEDWNKSALNLRLDAERHINLTKAKWTQNCGSSSETEKLCFRAYSIFSNKRVGQFIIWSKQGGRGRHCLYTVQGNLPSNTTATTRWGLSCFWHRQTCTCCWHFQTRSRCQRSESLTTET